MKLTNGKPENLGPTICPMCGYDNRTPIEVCPQCGQIAASFEATQQISLPKDLDPEDGRSSKDASDAT
jgi:uncharacterized membrane protein YvbJ